ncbi:MAG: PKD domain-containing protein [Bacteroidales bacterium]|nr:PKD domain-containing protein [Bacteroidales bacterium]
MKTFLFIIILSGLSSIAFGQFMYSNFDDQQNYQFLGWPNDPEIIDNPDPSGINTSEHVGRVERGAFEFAHVYCDTEGRIMVEENPIFIMKVWSPISCEILLKLENSENLELAIAVSSYITTPNQWEELTFDFSELPVDLYDKLVIFFDFNTFSNYIFYFDDIEGAEIEEFSPSDVTFNVDMTYANEFNPETDDVYIAGDFAGWVQPGQDTNLRMTPNQENPMIYTLTVPGIEAGMIVYKYFRVINDFPSWNWGEWEGDPNREVTVYQNMVIDDIWALILPEGDEIVADFEVGGTSLDILEIIGSGAWNNYPISETLEIIDNPDPTGINTSNKVLQFLRRGTDDGGESNAGFVVYGELNTLSYQYLHVMVWKPRITPLKLSCHDGSNYFHSFNMNDQHFAGAWVDIVFDLRANEYPTYLFNFMPDHEDPVTISELSTIYIDNFVLSNDSTPIKNPINNFEAGQTNVCENTPVQFSPDTAYVEYDSVMWLFPGGDPASSTALMPEVVYSNAGNYGVTLQSYLDGQQFEVFKAAYIEVFAVPDQPEIPSGMEIVCFNTPYSTYLTTNALSIWNLEPASAGTISYSDSICAVFWNYAFTGEAELRVKIFNGCGEGEFSDPLLIQRMEPSGVDFSASQTLLVEKPYTIAFTNLTPDLENYTFLWDFGNGEISTLAEPEYTYPESGEYSVTLTATHQDEGCVDSIYKEEYIFCSGVGINNPGSYDFSYEVDYSSNSLNLSFGRHPYKSKIVVYSLQGNRCYEAEIISSFQSIPLGNFISGLFIFKIYGEQSSHTGKFIYNANTSK